VLFWLLSSWFSASSSETNKLAPPQHGQEAGFYALLLLGQPALTTLSSV
jgi:hypothetical protein